MTTTQRLELTGGTIAYDDTGGEGPLIVMLPGAGDIRSEYRFLAPMLAADGNRVVTMDLRGHGESSAGWSAYGMAETAADMIALLDGLEAGPATVVATSFSPTAALWAAADRPDLIERLVLISAHLDDAPAWQRLPLGVLLRLPFAGTLWAGQYRGWHPGAPPSDLGNHAQQLADMVSDPRRRTAVRQTLIADRDGLEERLGRVRVPTLVIMGGADSHFPNPEVEGASIAARTGGRLVVIPNAGHYPQAEYPEQVRRAITGFLAESST